ncbi:MAG: penicillin-binding transpeptidase domain-containing protein [Gemmatimonadaceae bacterium]|nr:penicillin-binding transpeptidase domain-containing protein [Gemmatimonadaceae bacterium]
MRDDRSRWITGALALAAFALVCRAAWVQIWQHEYWTRKANDQQTTTANLPAPRGTITDATGLVLAESRTLVTIAIDPRAVRNIGALRRGLETARVAPNWIRRATDTTRKWVEIPQRFLPNDIATVQAMRGVRTTPVAERVYLPSESVRRLVGRATPERGLDGVEFALDSLLTGERGTAALVRDARGRTLVSPDGDGDAARPGHTVTLTVNHALQDIAERALADAQSRTGANGGDIVVLDPRDGAVLAMASRRPDPKSLAATAVTESFEPGSTLKPFFAGRLLDLRRARSDEVVNTYNGQMKLGTRTITDVHKAPRMSLREVIAQSSNIGIVQFAARLTAREEYELLRDLGFGTPTGVPYPLEASGRLRPPSQWSATSAASLAMGYEVSVSPLQLAVAYAAIANGGELLQPSLIRRITAPDGRVVWTHARRALRRVLSPEAAADVRRMLVEVVEEGTAGGADLAQFEVGGKSGTARRTGKGGRYAAGSYTASFVGLFPADDPQLVVLVKLDNPQGAYYGGKTAAPVFKAVLEGALASRDASIDRQRVAAQVRAPAESATADSVREVAAAAESRDARGDAVGDVPAVIDLTQPRGRAPALPARAVPSVDGLPTRRAVFTLHEAGFRVQLTEGAGVDPAPGTVLKPGSIVRLGRNQPR